MLTTYLHSLQNVHYISECLLHLSLSNLDNWAELMARQRKKEMAAIALFTLVVIPSGLVLVLDSSNSSSYLSKCT